MRWTRRSHGFTLTEMLVAITIFGMLSAAGIALLSASVRTQEISDHRLGEVGAVRRTASLLSADLAQAVARPWRDLEGRTRPAFAGRAGDEAMLLVFVRTRWDGHDARPARIAYRLREGRLERLEYPHVDGTAPGTAVLLLDQVHQARLRYRDRDGHWRERWDPTDPLRLPAAVELVTAREGEGPLRQLFLVGPQR